MKKCLLGKTIKQLEQAGFLDWTKNVFRRADAEIFLVGGAVRDLLLGEKNVKDFDFVVRGVPVDELKSLLAAVGEVDLVGRNFGVIKFSPRGQKNLLPFDIALPRTEVSQATGGYRDFKVNFNERLAVAADLGRRDFSVNALAYNIYTGEIIDEFGGLQDLKQGIIKTVGNAHERFAEDYSRLLRGIRFACQLDWQIDGVSWLALQKLMPRINARREKSDDRIVPYEVIASELLKAFVSNPLKAFDLYDKSGAFKALLPEVLEMKNCVQPENWHSEGDVWEHTRLCLKNLGSRAFKARFSRPIIFPAVSALPPGRPSRVGRAKLKNKEDLYNAELVMALLLHDVGKPATIETPEKDNVEKIRFYNHDVTGAQISRKIFERLKLSAAPEFVFDPDRAAWLIARHHLFDPVTVGAMKNATIEKYFFSDRFSGEDLLKLGFVDMLSMLYLETGAPKLDNFEGMLQRISELKKIGKGQRLPQPFLNGDEIMKILKIKPGKKVGEILNRLREKQLSGAVRNKKEALKMIKADVF